MVAFNGDFPRQKIKEPVRPQRRKRFNLRKYVGNWFGKSKKKPTEEKTMPFGMRAGNWFDQNVMMVVSPVAASKRIRERGKYAMLAATQEATEAFLSGRFNSIARNDDYREDRWNDNNLSPDAGMDEDLYDTQVRARELYRTNNVAISAIEGRVAHEVGEGIIPQSCVGEREGLISKPQAKALRREIERFYKSWSKSGVDSSRQHSFYAFQRMVCREFANMGEAFVLFGHKPNRKSDITLALQLISAERIETPPELASDVNCRMGIQYGTIYEKSEDGGWIAVGKEGADEVTGYWVRTVHPGHNLQPEIEHKFYPRFNEDGSNRMMHIFEPLFPEQSRGLPWLATAANRMKDLDDFFEAELIAKQIEACFGLYFQTPEGEDPHQMAEGNASSTNSKGMGEEHLSPGFVQYGDHQLHTVDPQRPGASFAPFIEAALRSIAGALNYPYELLAKNFHRTTFSSGKLAMLDGKRGFKMRASVLIDMLCVTVWDALVDNMVDYGLIDVDLDVYLDHRDLFQSHIWKGSPFGAIDEEKMVKARKVALESDQMTHSEIANEDGNDFFDQEDIREEEQLRKVERRLNVEAFEKQRREALGLPEMGMAEGDDPSPSDDKQTEARKEGQALEAV